MLWAGYVGPVGRLFSWPMYSYGELVAIHLFDESGGPVSIFDTRAPGEFVVPLDELELIVNFLLQRGVSVEGTGIVLGPEGEHRVTVEGGNVVVGEPAE